MSQSRCSRPLQGSIPQKQTATEIYCVRSESRLSSAMHATDILSKGLISCRGSRWGYDIVYRFVCAYRGVKIGKILAKPCIRFRARLCANYVRKLVPRTFHPGSCMKTQTNARTSSSSECTLHKRAGCALHVWASAVAINEVKHDVLRLVCCNVCI